MRIKLLETLHVPDENYEGEGPVPTATNYAGSVIDVSTEFALRAIASGKAVAYTPPAEEPAGETAAAVQQHFETQE